MLFIDFNVSTNIFYLGREEKKNGSMPNLLKGSLKFTDFVLLLFPPPAPPRASLKFCSIRKRLTSICMMFSITSMMMKMFLGMDSILTMIEAARTCFLLVTHMPKEVCSP